MKLSFQHPYKSIQQLPVSELPSFTIVTGANGSGKTHLLRAIEEGCLVVDDIPKNKIRFYTGYNMVPAHENGVVPRSLNRTGLASKFARLSQGALVDVLYLAKEAVKEQVILSKEVLAACVTGNAVSISLATQLLIKGVVDSYHDCLVTKIKMGELENEMPVHFSSEEANREFNYTYPQSSTQPQVTKLNGFECSIMLRLLAQGGKLFFDFSETDCLNLYPLVDQAIDPFQGTLTRLFAAYVREREQNDLDQIRFRRQEAESYLTEEQFLHAFGTAPWEVLNQFLTDAKLTFRFKRPNPDANARMDLQLVQISRGVDIKFADLSSGERVLLALAQFLFLSQDRRQPVSIPELVLLDEADAPLHPSMTADLLRIIQEVLVEKHGKRVILVTHSPSTVALASEKAVYVMDEATKRLRKATRDEGVRALTAGVPTLSINLANRRQVFVESENDVDYYERIAQLAKNYLHPAVSLSFIGSGQAQTRGNCERVKMLVNTLVEAGNRTVFGIVDWDAHYNGNTHVHVVGKGTHYSIENYVFNPLLVAILLFRERLVNRDFLQLSVEQSHPDLRTFSSTQLQQVVENVLTALDLSAPGTAEHTTVRFVNERTVQVPNTYLQMPGHDLETHIKSKFPALGKFKAEAALKKEILAKVLDDVPGLLPVDLVNLLRGIQEG
jgi:energy-coupling factor transporter ATP-binding protein EcfA2